MRKIEFMYNIGDIFDNIKITDKEIRIRHRNDGRNEQQKWYKYTCEKCGWAEGWIEENSLKRGRRCSCCHGTTLVVGINDMYTYKPWMTKYIPKEELINCTYGCAKYVDVKCPDCGKIKNIRIDHVDKTYGIRCNCGDGFSYPEKMIMCLLNQLDVRHTTQLSSKNFKWCYKYKYDFYLKDYNCIVEVHGRQHYSNEGFKCKGARTLEEEQENDNYKKQLALNNGIDEYIVLDCRESDLSWIKNSVLQSKLNNVFDLSKIDWLKCEEFATSNRIKQVCDYWNDTNCDMQELVNEIKLDRSTITRYLKTGTKFKWCNYTTKSFKTGRVSSKRKKVKIIKDDKVLGIFSYAKELEEKSVELFGAKLLADSIKNVCSGFGKTYKGYKFEYVESEEGKIC